MRSPCILVVLLLCAGTVHAECAWVLWEMNALGAARPRQTLEGKEDVKRQVPWEAKSAFTQLDECRKEIDSTIAALTAQAEGEVTRLHMSGEVTLLVARPPKEGVIALDVYRFRCLPDTVKPTF